MILRKICIIISIIIFLTGCNNEILNNFSKKITRFFHKKHWAEDYMYSLINADIMNGYSDGNLGLDDVLTREQAASIIYNLSGKIEPISSNFIDVPKDKWSFSAINSLKEQGIMNGFEDGSFRPNDLINRSEFSFIIYKFLNKLNFDLPNGLSVFSDTAELPYANAISSLNELGIISGYSDNSFKPFNPLTRGEAAKIISNLKNYIYENDNSNLTVLDEDIKTALEKGFENFDNIFSFKVNRNIKPEEIVNIYNKGFKGTYWVGIISNLSIETRTKGDISKVFVKVNYLHTKEEEKILTKFIKSTALNINQNFNTDLDKIKAAHDLIISKAKYKETKDGISSTGISVHSPYSILSSGECVCQGYALMNYRILKELGYNVIYIVGEAHNSFYNGSHAWNLVQLGPNWYHIDVTWDDPVPDIFNRINYDYFMLTDSEIAENHSWENSDYPSALVPLEQK